MNAPHTVVRMMRDGEDGLAAAVVIGCCPCILLPDYPDWQCLHGAFKCMIKDLAL